MQAIRLTIEDLVQDLYQDNKEKVKLFLDKWFPDMVLSTIVVVSETAYDDKQVPYFYPYAVVGYENGEKRVLDVYDDNLIDDILATFRDMTVVSSQVIDLVAPEKQYYVSDIVPSVASVSE